MSIMTKKTLAVACLFLFSTAALAQDVWDSDGDGFDDNKDNCTLVANPLQRDTDGDYNGNMCDADFNNDFTVNALDLGIMRVRFLTPDPDADLNGDAFVDLQDVGIMRQLYLAAPGPTGADPGQPPCDCYFSFDCNGGGGSLFCNYGPGNFATEDICAWRDIKPDGVFGAGCSIESDLTTGAWTPDICDGVCAPASAGSSFGLENTALVAQAIEIWGDAMLNPSVSGGGPVDPELAAQASAIQFNGQDVPIMLGRYTADALGMAAGEPFYEYFCHYEAYPEDNDPITVDLAGNDCRITAGQLTVQALSAELQAPGSAAGIMQGIVTACSNWQELFTSQCEVGPGALDCAVDFVESLAYFLSTPPTQPAARPDPVFDLLRTAIR